MRSGRVRYLAGALALAGGLHQGAVAAPCDLNERQKLTAADGAPADSFGSAVDMSGDVAIVGARGDDDRGQNSGSAYVFRYDGATWVQEQKLIASDGAPSDSFGESVAISGDVAIVGARNHDDNGSNSGAAYVFRYDGATWTETKLTASDGAADDQFGFSVSIDGDVAVVGAYLDDDNGSGSGSVYVFRYDGAAWAEEQKLIASDGAVLDFFGFSVSVSGTAALVGANFDDDRGGGSGSAYVFRYDGDAWTEEQKLLASDGAEGDQLGYASAISGDVAIAGAYLDDDNGESAGSAYVFRYDGATWLEDGKLLAADGAARDEFGKAVAINGDAAIVGSGRDDDGGDGAGSAYVYRHDGAAWVEQSKLLASDGAALDFFGSSVDVSGDLAFVGAVSDDDRGDGSGSTYVFDLTACLCPADLDQDGLVGFSDLTAVLAAWGEKNAPEDLDTSGIVDFEDLLIVLDAWGPCP